MSYKVVLIESSGHECGNAMRFATEKEAEDSYWELASRWTACPAKHRIEECDDTVTYEMVDGRPRSIATGHVPARSVKV
jgi:hypothetical protein